MERFGGVILCGGQSKRMGQPKAWLPIGEEVMLQRVTRILSDVVSPIVVVAAPEQNVPELPSDIEIVRDEAEGKGPLQGLAAGLRAIRNRADAVFLSSCDVPFLRQAFVTRMSELLQENQICVPQVGEHFHPLAAVYRVAVLSQVDQLLSEDRLRPFFLFEQVPTRIVEADELRDIDPTFESLRNLNRPEDYEAALREIE